MERYATSQLRLAEISLKQPPNSMRSGALLLVLATLVGCRESATSTAGSTSLPIEPNDEGASGCVGPDQTFTAGQVPSTVTLATLSIAPESQLAAARGGEVLYATGAGATVVQLDFTGGAVPVETTLVSAGVVATLYAQPDIGIVDPPVLSAITVLDADSLVVMEQTANVLLLVSRTTPDDVSLLAGQPSLLPGFADGFANDPGGPGSPLPLCRFSFDRPAELVATGEMPPRVFINDPGNHALRQLDFTSGFVSTLAGSGAPFFEDGDLSQTLFDTPVGMTLACDDALVLSEASGSVAGNRLRRVTIGASNPFGGGLFGISSTLAGDGMDMTTEGVGELASLGSPASPFATASGELYWVDSTSGVLRRLSGEMVDCPLHTDCATAVGAPNFSPGGVFSVTQTEGGVLYVLDATAGTLFRVTP